MDDSWMEPSNDSDRWEPHEPVTKPHATPLALPPQPLGDSRSARRRSDAARGRSRDAAIGRFPTSAAWRRSLRSRQAIRRTIGVVPWALVLRRARHRSTGPLRLPIGLHAPSTVVVRRVVSCGMYGGTLTFTMETRHDYKRRGLAEPVEGKAALFSGEVAGLAVQLATR